MYEFGDKGKSELKIGQKSDLFEHICGALDQRDCIMMKHIIMAEIRKSNVPLWVTEELEKKLECFGCWNALGKRQTIRRLHSSQVDRPSSNSG